MGLGLAALEEEGLNGCEEVCLELLESGRCGHLAAKCPAPRHLLQVRRCLHSSAEWPDLRHHLQASALSGERRRLREGFEIGDSFC